MELIDSFLGSLSEKGRAPDTVITYSAKLHQLYSWLPEDKQIRGDTLWEWRNDLLAEGYAARTVNLCISAANSLLEYCGQRGLQVGKQLMPDSNIQPELTRNEYLRLLSTARLLGKEREYLMIKVFATVGISVRDLPRLTVEAVQNGKIRLPTDILHIPDCLREELLDYVRRECVSSGPVFLSKDGKPYTRTGVTSLIRRLCHDAQIPEEKANPRCLKKLYQATRAGIQANIAVLAEQAYDRLLETEQITIGWEKTTADPFARNA